MKRKLLAVALPIVLVAGVGCSNKDVVEEKKTDSVQVAEAKEKVSKEDYPARMSNLDYELKTKMSEITKLSQRKDKDVKSLNKEILKSADELQEVFAKFYKVDPPKEFEEPHKTVIKGIDCYKKAFDIQISLAKSGSVTKKKTEELQDLMYKGNDYMEEGFEPINKAVDHTKKPSQNYSLTILSKDGKEFIGEWGSYNGDTYTKGSEYRQDGTYTIFDDVDHTPYENSHMDGRWSYNADTQQMTLTIDEYMKDGKKAEPGEMKDSMVYTVKIFRIDEFKMIDDDGNTLHQVKRR
ncbi:DUF7018 domain-containing (lipo)protein [Bacillus pseudomycoides]|uniref:DUF7018 domain-containing (lipo)protein n=1 Tax=Bacillus pseudomycoides TaxID=64104 RepID=UPI000BEE052E|nr:hypothetical protein [Bacillus pseudomycoides]PED06496.1 hypothetical protein COO19_20585 [Bacillus pseudomycoides]PEI86381.1 hypothetical protein CN686_27965 [Bacillus pseudomycoides]PEK09792.1 hypothetical protein CN693_27665 [Bacillus pseudomycoides]PEM71503.1 hypothetical protein CN619_18515 [Bacillus pseudomycoides]PEO07747.1 hypothetical protein CN542_26340 [Bacillus pseudomycoides]